MEPRGLPSSVETERAILASILLDPGAMLQVSGRLLAEDFFLDRHQLIYRAMLDLMGDEMIIDIRTVQARLEQVGDFERSGGLGYLASLDLDLPDLSRVSHYVDIVKDRATLRSLIRISQEGIRRSLSGEDSALTVLGRQRLSMEALLSGSSHGNFSPAGAVASEVIRAAEGRLESRLQGLPMDPRKDGIPWGSLVDVTRAFGRMCGRRMIYVGGRPGLGKTSFVLQVGVEAAIRDRIRVGVFSLEMGGNDVVSRIIAQISGVPSSRIEDGDMSESEWVSVGRAQQALEGACVMIDDTSSLSSGQVHSRAEAMRRDSGIDLLVVDFLSLVRPNNHGASNRTGEVIAISEELGAVAKALNIPVLVAAQLSRHNDSRPKAERRPRLSDLRDGGEQAAWSVLMIHREEVYEPDNPDLRGRAEILCVKNRSGPLGVVEVAFDGPSTRFSSIYGG